VDTFVIYDDVNYIKCGWINRNNILEQGKAKLISLETLGASPNKLIKEVSVGQNQRKLIRTISQNYSRAPYFSEVLALVEEVLHQNVSNLADFLSDGLQQVSGYLGLQRKWCMSSSLQKDNNLRGQDKVLAICQELGATHYINMPGGKTLYDAESFAKLGIQLSFIQPRTFIYRQFSEEFVPNLSIIDVMMFNSREKCCQLLQEYELG
jgi:hypothetical protein